MRHPGFNMSVSGNTAIISSMEQSLSDPSSKHNTTQHSITQINTLTPSMSTPNYIMSNMLEKSTNI